MKKKEKKSKTERNKGVTQATLKEWDFKSGFLQLVCKASLIFSRIGSSNFKKIVTRVKSCCDRV